VAGLKRITAQITDSAYLKLIGECARRRLHKAAYSPFGEILSELLEKLPDADAQRLGVERGPGRRRLAKTA